MTEKDHTPEVSDCGIDVAAYALGALDPAEADAFRTHLRTCAVCRDELAAFQNVVDVLPMSAPQHRSPAGLRRRTLDAVANEPRRGLQDEPRRRSPRVAMRLSIPRPALALGAVLIVALAVVAGVQIGSTGASTHVYAAQVSGTGSAEVTVSASGAKLVVRGMAPPPAGHIYQVWLQRPGQPPAPTDALFSVSSRGDGDVDVPGDLHGVSKVLVTPEPFGGRNRPTHAPVISAQLT